MAQLIDLSLIPALDDDGDPISGAGLRFYLAGTLTPVTVYADADLDTAHPTPLLSDSSGRFPAVYVSGTQALRARVEQGVAILRDLDPIYTPLTASDISTTSGLTVQQVLNNQPLVSVETYGASGDGLVDDTAAFVAAMAASRNIFIPPGTYLVNIDLTGKRGYTFQGAGRDVTVLKNFNANPVFKLDNTTGDCKMNVFSDFRVQSRDKAVYTTTDAFVLQGNGTNENDFHVFQRLEVMSFRRGFSLLKRHVWCSWEDVHVYDCIADGFYIDTDDNISAMAFRQVRSGQNGGHGFYVRKNSGDPLAAWTFENVTLEKNGLCGLYVTGTSTGIAGWSLKGLYCEENTGSILAGATGPRKANIDINAALCLGIDISGSNLFGTPAATPLDWAIHISSTTASGFIGANRAGTFAQGFASVPGGFLIIPPSGGTGTIVKGDASFVMNELTSEITGTDTLTLTGCTTSPTGTSRGVKQRNQVTLFLPTITGTSNTTAATLTGLPVAFRPARTQTVLLRVTNAGTTALGIAEIGTDGTITLYKDAGGGAFTNTGTKGIQQTTITYSVE